ncbi:MAG: glucose-1-phosphate adenylyltransferase subunit GlgD [Clostridiales bacterium]|nr:glucose-1-phosphate adenylyltransferase subunit GlgD [Clostridiales bacterium]MCD7827988.1 glucose-1-phosphate adenylyltransferase subunit GlgD [Clostridiales bacterium]
MRANNVLGILFTDAYNDCISDLTALRTMSSVPFGGRYRFIDFPLSNMVNCGISKVGVITKSNYRSLMDHLGTGKPWDLSRKNEGLFLLPPFNHGNKTYSDKIEALTSVSDFIHMSKEEIVILCDCNIICNMDFGKLIEYHIEKRADITLCTKNGKYPMLDNILKPETDGEGKITKLSLSPAAEEGEGDYCVNFIVINKPLLERLINESAVENYNVFERDILVKNVGKLGIYAYNIDTYCKVIDSMQTYYDTNMDLLNPCNRESVFDSSNPVFTKVNDDMPSIYGLESNVKNSFLADGCKIYGQVENSILFRGVQIAKGASVKNSIIMQSCYIGEDAKLDCVIMDKYGVIRPRKSISGDIEYPIYIGKKIII